MLYTYCAQESVDSSCRYQMQLKVQSGMMSGEQTHAQLRQQRHWVSASSCEQGERPSLLLSCRQTTSSRHVLITCLSVCMVIASLLRKANNSFLLSASLKISPQFFGMELLGATRIQTPFPSSLLFSASMTLACRCPTPCPLFGLYLAALKCKEEKHPERNL